MCIYDWTPGTQGCQSQTLRNQRESPDHQSVTGFAVGRLELIEFGFALRGVLSSRSLAV